jgi:hypothetical protein
MRKKLDRLGSQVVVVQKPTELRTTTTSDLVLPEELISAEDALKALSQPGLPRQDIQRLGLEVEVDKQRIKTGCLSTTNFELPEDLPSVEEALKDLAAAMNALKT